MARQPHKCCGCVPLRPGLLAWAYIKLVNALTSVGVCVYLMSHQLRHFVHRVDEISRYRSPVIYILEKLWPLGVCLLLIVFAIIFIIGVHRQSYKMLLVYLVFSLFEVMLAGACVGWQLYDFIVNLSSYRRDYGSATYDIILKQEIPDPVLYLGFIQLVVLNMLLPIYLIVLIKSEVQRLKAARGETPVILDVPVTKEQDNTYDLVYSNKTPVRGKPLFPVEELERLRQQLGVKNL